MEMYSGFATKEGTQAYFQTRAIRPSFYNETDSFYISSIGLGTYAPEAYKDENYDFSFKDVVKEAILGGINFIDTAINYRCQVSEKEIGEALKELIEEKAIAREEIIIASKGGFIPLEYPFPENPYQWISEKIVHTHLSKEKKIAIDQHTIAPKYLRWSLETSLKNLGIETLDIFYIHNPEFQLGHISKKELYGDLEEAFIEMEKAVKDGLIKSYGIASWNGFLYEESNMEYLNLYDVKKIADKVAKKNHFKHIQVPYNLAKTHAYVYTNQRYADKLYYTLFQVAKKLDIEVITSSSFLRMNLFRKPFSNNIRALLGQVAMSDVQRGLQFCRSSGQNICSLFSTKHIENLKHNLELKDIERTPPSFYEKIFHL